MFADSFAMTIICPLGLIPVEWVGRLWEGVVFWWTHVMLRRTIVMNMRVARRWAPEHIVAAAQKGTSVMASRAMSTNPHVNILSHMKFQHLMRIRIENVSQ
jgi:hypothetical protein